MTEYPTEQRAGGLVFRIGGLTAEYLLVTSNSNKNRWIIPAGHVEPGETASQAALREVTEEAGITAILIAELGQIKYFWKQAGTNTLIITSLFLMEYQQTIAFNPEGRTVEFFPFPELIKLNLWDETRLFLQQTRQTAARHIQSRLSASK